MVVKVTVYTSRSQAVLNPGGGRPPDNGMSRPLLRSPGEITVLGLNKKSRKKNGVLMHIGKTKSAVKVIISLITVNRGLFMMMMIMMMTMITRVWIGSLELIVLSVNFSYQLTFQPIFRLCSSADLKSQLSVEKRVFSADS